MPSTLHEAFAHLLRQRPDIIAELLHFTASGAPKHDSIVVRPAELGDHRPTELRADGVFGVFLGQEAVLAVVLEVQLWIARQKLFVWPSYLVSARASLRTLDAVLFVITNDLAVPAWARQPIPLGPGSGFVQAHVLGPAELPLLTDATLARAHPTYAALTAAVHGRVAEPREAARAALIAAEAVREALQGGDALLCYDLLVAALGTQAREVFEMLPQGYQFADEGFRRAAAEGKAEGKAEDILAVLEAREVAVSPALRARILECRDLGALDLWLRAAATCATADALFSR
ncbi:MAG: hypothetical protein IT376_18450 [Polyangiaceae bacterium]|nr:hypothetical protein [Polyangiaceae bacterium]